MGRVPAEDFVNQEPPTVTGTPHQITKFSLLPVYSPSMRMRVRVGRSRIVAPVPDARHGTGFGTTRIPETRAVSPSAVARRSNPPGCRPVSSPSALTVATAVLPDVHSASTSSRVDPSESSRLARNCAVWSTVNS